MARSRTILVIDDTPMFRDLCALFLSRLGRVLCARDGEEGLSLAHSHRPDVVLLDLMMPGLDGAEVCRRIRAEPESASTPIVILTGSPLAEDHERAIVAGADQVIRKPISRVALIDAVNRYLRSPVARGMPRVRLETPIIVRHRQGSCDGMTRNVSRGGMFVALGSETPPEDEVALEFRLPHTSDLLTPTAKIVWRQHVEPGHRAGMGLRFMRLDGTSARRLNEYVQEHHVSPF